ncbi:uncharacterized protein LOC119724427 [Patiria miniata]|uniref:Uncharacterized protein n=1 Tax=Patiria miniata TaxID=46514 RepID=A0A913ZHZ6_PATMI|nr:uncharacterized protein LOC119724427 [Patiria miniata]
MEDSRQVVQAKSPAWPRALLASWTLLGVFKGRQIDATKPCMLCSPAGSNGDKLDEDAQAQRDKEMDENANLPVRDNITTEESLDSRCPVCLSLLWNADGMVVSDYTDAVPRWVNNRLVGSLSLLFVSLYLVCCVGTLGWYFYEFWGDLRQVTHFVSFLSYGGILLGVAWVCTASNVLQYVRRAPGNSCRWYNVLHADYIARRLRCLTGRKFRLPASMFLTLSILWAVVNVAFQVVSLVQFLNSGNLKPEKMSSNTTCPTVVPQTAEYAVFVFVKTFLGMVIAAIGLPIYAAFWHYVLVMRKGLTAELNLVLVFVKNNEGRVDWCRRRVVEIHREVSLLRRILVRLMPFIVATGVLGLTVHISWNYNVYSDSEHEKCQKNLAKDNLIINIFIFSEKFMVLFLPLLAVGGLNIDHIWQQFTYALSRLKNSDHEEFWDRLMHFTKELDPEHKDIDLTVVLAVVSLYLGRNLTGQQLDYTKSGA